VPRRADPLSWIVAVAMSLGDDLALLYAGALVAIARADGEIGLEEGLQLRRVVARRAAVDPEAMFFVEVSAARLATAVGHGDGAPFRHGAAAAPRQLATALVHDGVAVALADGDLNDAEVHAILAFTNALGCSIDDVVVSSPRLAAYLHVPVPAP
jgi:uncharacterized tellurite resistance protein B-like protein